MTPCWFDLVPIQAINSNRKQHLGVAYGPSVIDTTTRSIRIRDDDITEYSGRPSPGCTLNQRVECFVL